MTSIATMSKTPSSIVNLYVQKDLKRLKDDVDKFPIVFVEPMQDNRSHLEAAISGPSGTPYEGGVFLLRVMLSEQYPVC